MHGLRVGRAVTAKLTALELFGGGGGAGWGIHEAGFDSLAVEYWRPAADVAKAAGLRTIHADVRNHGAWLTHVCVGLSLLWASPPCQAFSPAGKRRGAADERNGWPWFFAALDALRAQGCGPQIVICENVPGMLHHIKRAGCRAGRDPKPDECGGCYWTHQVVPDMQRRFPYVSGRVLDAADYGVPQSRTRLFLVGSFAPFAWPSSTHSAHALAAEQASGAYWTRHGLEPRGVVVRLPKGPPPADGLLPWRTVRDVLATLPPDADLRSNLNTDGQVGGDRGRRSVDRPAPTVRACEGTGAEWVRIEGSNGQRGPNPARSVNDTALTVTTAGDMYAHTAESLQVVGGGRRDPKRGLEGWKPRDVTDTPAPAVTTFGGTGAIFMQDKPDAHIRAEQGGAVGRSVDRPAPTVQSTSVLELHGADPGRCSRAGTEPDRWDRPSPTVTTTEEKGTRASAASGWTFNGGPDRASDAAFLAVGRRRLSVAECAALQDFPPSWPWGAARTTSNAYTVVGNAVPPALARALATAAAEHVFRHRVPPTSRQLGLFESPPQRRVT